MCDEWQPISTAPKDGAEFIGAEYCPPNDEVDEPWVRNVWCTNWNTAKRCFVNGWNEPVEPTHWLPLPAPPAPSAEAGEGT